MKRLLILSLLVLCVVGCQSENAERGYVMYGYVIPPENLEKAALFIEKTCAAANPKSDEEGEDLVARVEETALKIYGKKVIGIQRGGYDKNFVPYDDLNEYDKKRCDKYMKGE